MGYYKMIYNMVCLFRVASLQNSQRHIPSSIYSHSWLIVGMHFDEFGDIMCVLCKVLYSSIMEA